MLMDDRMDDMTGLVCAEDVAGFPPTFFLVIDSNGLQCYIRRMVCMEYKNLPQGAATGSREEH